MDRIEETLREITITLKAVANAQANTQDATKTLAASQARTSEAITDLASIVSRYIEAGDARTRRLEG